MMKLSQAPLQSFWVYYLFAYLNSSMRQDLIIIPILQKEAEFQVVGLLVQSHITGERQFRFFRSV